MSNLCAVQTGKMLVLYIFIWDVGFDDLKNICVCSKIIKIIFIWKALDCIDGSIFVELFRVCVTLKRYICYAVAIL